MNKVPFDLCDFKYAVYAGSERLDLGPERVSVLCESEEQAKHMAKFWAPYGYYEPLDQTRTDGGGAITSGYLNLRY